MTARLLIHVGLHKTGTTWLQRRIFAAGDGVDFAYCGDVGRIHDAFIRPAADRFEPAAGRAAFWDVLHRAEPGTGPGQSPEGRIAVLSDEGLGGRPFHALHERAIHAARLAAAFPQARILITVREQSRIIYSMYGQYLRYGHTSPLAAFLAVPPAGSVHQPVLDRDYYDYERMFAVYARHFPADNILILPMEWMLADPVAALARIGDFCGKPLAVPQQESTRQVENRASSDLAYEAMRWVNHLISQDSRWHGKGLAPNPNAVGYWVDRLTPERLRRRMATTRMDRIAAEIGNCYAASNTALAERIGINLGALGYQVVRPSPPS